MRKGSGLDANITGLLHAWRGGDRAALAAAMPDLYVELRRMAAARLRGEHEQMPLCGSCATARFEES